MLLYSYFFARHSAADKKTLGRLVRRANKPAFLVVSCSAAKAYLLAFLAGFFLVDRLAVVFLAAFFVGLAFGDRLAVALAVVFLAVFFVVAISFGSSIALGVRLGVNKDFLGHPVRGKLCATGAAVRVKSAVGSRTLPLWPLQAPVWLVSQCEEHRMVQSTRR